MTAEIRDYVRDRLSEHEFTKQIFNKNLLSLINDGMQRAEEGITTIEEVLRSGLRTV